MEIDGSVARESVQLQRSLLSPEVESGRQAAASREAVKGGDTVGSDTVELSEEGLVKSQQGQEKTAASSEESQSPVEQLLKKMEKQIEELKKEIQALEQAAAVDDEEQQEMIAHKKEQLLQLEVQHAAAVAAKEQGES
ncbi:hypothetical protein [Desulfogranum mediterraneum]|uniref:hypothetical protein n=1 Tax=Desulfogranum mediterraneum TaxID=160661 RepID=UPI0012948706|nr:hypothetical protein [Desulfogranum mediterraneum]